MRTIRYIIIFLLLICINTNSATVYIEWYPPINSNNIIGYKVHYGNSSRSYTTTIDLGGPASLNKCAISNLSSSLSYYFVLTSYSSTKRSPYSSELVWDNTPPKILFNKTNYFIRANSSNIIYIPLVTYTVSDNFSNPTNITILQIPPYTVPITNTISTTFTNLFYIIDEASNTNTSYIKIKMEPYIKIISPTNLHYEK